MKKTPIEHNAQSIRNSVRRAGKPEDEQMKLVGDLACLGIDMLMQELARCKAALHEAIDRPKGEVPDSALRYYDPSPPPTGSASPKRITFYEMKYYMFSNFSSFAVHYEGRDWMTSEHAYQAMKFREPMLQEWVRSQRSAHDAMKAAQSKPELYRSDWEEVKIGVMLEICRAKLSQHPYIQGKLLETGDSELIESSPIDSFWGWGPNKDGENHLGRVWMTLRNGLRMKNAESEVRNERSE